MHLWLLIECEHEWTDVEDEASSSDKHGKLGNMYNMYSVQYLQYVQCTVHVSETE